MRHHQKLSSHFPHARPAVMCFGFSYYLFLVCVRMSEDCQELVKDSVMDIKEGKMTHLPKSNFVFAGFPCDDVSSINNRRQALWLYEPNPIFLWWALLGLYELWPCNNKVATSCFQPFEFSNTSWHRECHCNLPHCRMSTVRIRQHRRRSSMIQTGQGHPSIANPNIHGTQPGHWASTIWPIPNGTMSTSTKITRISFARVKFHAVDAEYLPI